MKDLWRLKPYIRPYFWLIFASGLLGVPLAALRASPVPLVNWIGNDLFITKDPKKLLLFPALFIGLYVLNFIFRFLHYYLLRIVVARVNQKIKNDLFEHLMGLSADYFTAQSTGTLISRVGTDPQYIDNGLSCINILIREPFTFLFLLGGAVYLNWRLSLLIFLIFPLLFWVFRATGRNLKRYISRMTEENAKLYSTLQESFTGIRMVGAFRLEKYVRNKFRERSESFTRTLLKTAILEEAAHPLVELIGAVAIACVINYGGLQVIQGKMSPPELFAFFTAFFLMVSPLRMLNEVNIKLYSAAAACKRIFEIFDWKTNLHESEDPKHIGEFKEEIKFRNVSFAYPDSPEREVLREMSFSVPRGKAIAIVGESGAGKSSLVSLLPRVFDVTRGSIEIDGQDIRELNLDDLRKLFAVVSQDIFLFNDTIEENIRCGKLSATAEEIRDAARKAHALDFIESLPRSFQTLIGDRGLKLSGGERQRVSIARAFLRNAPILVLDEATSSLDMASEREVQKALEELMVDKTTLMIAHRLSTIKHADQILVMNSGQIVETGSHDELIRLKGEYARFH